MGDCDHCNGTGRIVLVASGKGTELPCSRCKGTGGVMGYGDNELAAVLAAGEAEAEVKRLRAERDGLCDEIAKLRQQRRELARSVGDIPTVELRKRWPGWRKWAE